MGLFLCSECNDVNCILLNTQSILGVSLLPNLCIKCRKKNPKWQRYTKTVDLFRACKEGSEHIVFRTASCQHTTEPFWRGQTKRGHYTYKDDDELAGLTNEREAII